MALERTISIIKPDAVAKNVIGEIYSRFEKAGLRIVAAKMKHLSRKEAEGFYAVHRERPFFGALVEFMKSLLSGCAWRWAALNGYGQNRIVGKTGV